LKIKGKLRGEGKRVGGLKGNKKKKKKSPLMCVRRHTRCCRSETLEMDGREN